MKICSFLLLLGIFVVAGCQRRAPVVEEVTVEDAPADDQIVSDSLRSGVKLTTDYTSPATEAEAAAKPDDILYDSTGKPYKVIKHIGLDN